MTNEKTLEILLVEDNPEFSNPALKVLGNEGHRTELATTLKEAEQLRRQKKYDFVLIDGFFPYTTGKVNPGESKELEEYRNRFSKVLGGRFGFDSAMACLWGDSYVPFGLMLAENIKTEGNDSYLVVSTASHANTNYTYHVLNDYARAKGLNLYLEEADCAKANPKYWENVVDLIKSKNKSQEVK